MTAPSRAVRATIPSTSAATAAEHANFAYAYEVGVPAGDTRTAEQWARTAWECAPTPLRWFITAGWRLVLGLRLGPRRSRDHILGWRIVDCHPEEIACQLDSWFLNGYNTFRLTDGHLIWSTFVTYERPIAKVIWPPVSILHRALVRSALRRAARHPERTTSAKRSSKPKEK